MNLQYESNYQYRCSYPFCQSKRYYTVLHNRLSEHFGNVIFDIATDLRICYYPTCAYHGVIHNFPINSDWKNE